MRESVDPGKNNSDYEVQGVQYSMHFLITGHTGFKGSWMTAFLKAKGHSVSGYSDGVLNGSLYQKANLGQLNSLEHFADIRDTACLAGFIKKVKPDCLIHFAAQSIVRESYRNPEETFGVNVEGTSSLLHAVKQINENLITLVVTTDKVYKDLGHNRAYIESDPLQGSEPYGQSKAIADLTTQYWIENNLIRQIAIVRAGNVIGGGDISPERLMPELISKYMSGGRPDLRFPTAIRPWQHVLDCLNGYFVVLENLLQGGQSDVWNIGPDFDSHVTVKSIQELTASFLDINHNHVSFNASTMPETGYLALNSDKLRSRLGWSNKFGLEDSVFQSINWHIKVNGGLSPLNVTFEQVESFLALPQ